MKNIIMKDLNKKTLEELKALVYDLLVKQQDTNRELQVINQLIAQKEVEPKEKVEEQSMGGK